MFVGSDDLAAINLAIARLDVRGKGGRILIPGLSAVSGQISLPTGVSLCGNGRAAADPFRFFSRGTGLTHIGPGGSSTAFVTCASTGSHIEDISIDASHRYDYCLAAQGTRNHIRNANIGRGAAITLYSSAGSQQFSGSEIYGMFAGTTFQGGGDLILDNNLIYGSGDTLANVYIKDAVDDAMVHNNHVYKGGWSIPLLSADTGPNLKMVQSSGVTGQAPGGIIQGNVFDTCYGNHIEIEQQNTGATTGIKALTINGNQFYQPQSAVPDNTYSCIKVTSGVAGTANVYIAGLSITGNVAKGYDSTHRYKSFIDWNVLATYGNITGGVVVGNSATFCAAGYTASGAAYTPTALANANSFSSDGLAATAF
jgi:hypothetical protein